MIPKNIAREHLLKAIDEVETHGVPQNRESTRYDLVFEGKTYSPKYLVSLANTWANGEELDATTFMPTEARLFLLDLGFEVRRKGGRRT